MNLKECLEILDANKVYESQTEIGCNEGFFMDWQKGNKTVFLEGDFTPEELEAIAYKMKLK